MDLALSEEQEQLVSSFAAMLAKASSPMQVRASEATGHDPALWNLLQESGAVRMGVVEHHDGWGAELLDLCLVAEELGRHCASVPLIEAQVAARLLAEVGSAPAVESLARVIAGDALVVFAPHPARRTGAALVPGGAVCDFALVLDGERLLLVGTQDRMPIRNLASAALADINLAGGIELLSGTRAVDLFETALDEWLVLTASAVVGLSSAGHDLGCSYARERRAFGSSIGAFQAISHPFADDATSIDGARLLVRKAAWEADTRRPRSRELAAMAFAFASTIGQSATYHALHAHGGYGFMLEYDIQLHYRRAHGWPHVWGDAEQAYRRAAAAHVREDETLMDFTWPPSVEQLRADVKEFLDEHLTPALEGELYLTGVAHDPEFSAAMGERHWIVPEWPRDGVEPLGVAAIHVLTEELTRADAPFIALATTEMVARVIRNVGSPELQAVVLPGVLAGEITIALGMTEPEAGSDVAAVQTKARRIDDDWIINGQKMFTTNGHIADYVFLLARTDPSSERHRGLTTFLVPTDSRGIEAQAVHTIGGERTNILFLSDVSVDDRWRISEVGAGWQSLMLALQDEHSAPFSPHLGRLLEAAELWAETPDADGAIPLDRDDVQLRLTKVATELEVAQLLELRSTWVELSGEVPVVEGPMSKLFSTEAMVRGAEDIAALIGPDALRSRGEPSAVSSGIIEHRLRYSLGMTIYAGTSEVQRNIIAQRRCRLPRS